MKYLFILIASSAISMFTYWAYGGNFERGRELGGTVVIAIILWFFFFSISIGEIEQ